MGPLLFHVFLADLFLIQYDIDIAMLADDNTPHISDKIIEDVIDYRVPSTSFSVSVQMVWKQLFER